MGSVLSSALGFNASESCGRGTRDVPAAQSTLPPAQTHPPPALPPVARRLPPLPAASAAELVFYSDQAPDATPFQVALDNDLGFSVPDFETFAQLSTSVNTAIEFYRCGLRVIIGPHRRALRTTHALELHSVLDEGGATVGLAVVERDVSEEFVRDDAHLPMALSLLQSFLGQAPSIRRVQRSRVHIVGVDGAYQVYEACVPLPVFVNRAR